jgi:hypothetical protein
MRLKAKSVSATSEHLHLVIAVFLFNMNCDWCDRTYRKRQVSTKAASIAGQASPMATGITAVSVGHAILKIGRLIERPESVAPDRLPFRCVLVP